jgi:TerC family integral membrane protein
MTDWVVLLGIALALFAIDLVPATLRPHAIGFREAAVWWGLFVAAAAGFAVILAFLEGGEYAAQFTAGYIVELSLSVDNLFVFVIIMSSFAVPREHQQRVLIFGIGTALCLRAGFIAVGAVLLELLSFMFLIFGLVLIWTAVRMLAHRGADPHVADGPLVRVARRILPVSDQLDDGRLITRDGGHRVVTPLFIVFIAIGGTDVLFALDSIPAVFGVTDEAYIVFAANAFALLGLRALFFLVTGLLDRLVYLSVGLAVILSFIGVKLILHWAHGLSAAVPEISTALSLAVIGAVLAVTTVASLARARAGLPPHEETAQCRVGQNLPDAMAASVARRARYAPTAPSWRLITSMKASPSPASDLPISSASDVMTLLPLLRAPPGDCRFTSKAFRTRKSQVAGRRLSSSPPTPTAQTTRIRFRSTRVRVAVVASPALRISRSEARLPSATGAVKHTIPTARARSDSRFEQLAARAATCKGGPEMGPPLHDLR